MPHNQQKNTTHLPTSTIRTGFAQKWGLCQVNPLCVIAYKLMKQLTLQLDMCATTCPQAPSEQVLPRNLLPGGLCKIHQLCAIAYKLMNNWPYSWTCVPLPAHKPRLNRFCPEISFLGAWAKSINYVLLLSIACKLMNNWPCNWKCVKAFIQVKDLLEIAQKYWEASVFRVGVSNFLYSFKRLSVKHFLYRSFTVLDPHTSSHLLFLLLRFNP